MRLEKRYEHEKYGFNDYSTRLIHEFDKEEILRKQSKGETLTPEEKRQAIKYAESNRKAKKFK